MITPIMTAIFYLIVSNQTELINTKSSKEIVNFVECYYNQTCTESCYLCWFGCKQNTGGGSCCRIESANDDNCTTCDFRGFCSDCKKNYILTQNYTKEICDPLMRFPCNETAYHPGCRPICRQELGSKCYKSSCTYKKACKKGLKCKNSICMKK